MKSIEFGQCIYNIILSIYIFFVSSIIVITYEYLVSVCLITATSQHYKALSLCVTLHLTELLDEQLQ